MQNRDMETSSVGKSPHATKKVTQRSDRPAIHHQIAEQPHPMDQITCRLGDASCAGAHAAEVRRSTRSRHPTVARSLLQLQQEYGNNYVQRVMAQARQTGYSGEATQEVENAIQRARGGGQSLDSNTRTKMESAFGADFSGVRVHTGAESDHLNRSLNARAFTTGRDIFFRQGAYNPGSNSGRELLAHELTHVVQQSGDEVKPKLTIGQPGDRFEQEADLTARAIVQQEASGIQKQAQEMTVILRQPEEDEEEELQPKHAETCVQCQEEDEQEIPLP